MGTGMDWVKQGSAFLKDINPLLQIGGGILGGVGGYFEAKEENKRADRELGYRTQKDFEDRKRTDRSLGQNAIGVMNDNYENALFKLAQRGR